MRRGIARGALRRAADGLRVAAWLDGIFLRSALAGEVGHSAVMPKIFRSMWQGVTESNLERVNAAEGHEPDRRRGGRSRCAACTCSNFGDSGVSSRVFAEIRAVPWACRREGDLVLVRTRRPELPVDLKSPG